MTKRSPRTQRTPAKRAESMPARYADGCDGLLGGFGALLEEARRTSAGAVNAVLSATYWEIGRSIVEHEQQGEAHAAYGKKLLERLATDLTAQFGRGFGMVSLGQMKRFYRLWPTREILQTSSEDPAGPGSTGDRGILPTVSEESALASRCASRCRGRPTWRLLSVKNEQARDFYDGGTAQRLVGAAARPPDPVPVLRANRALQEQGGDAEEGREPEDGLRIGDEWFRVDLVFYHRRLRCLVVTDLKLGRFTLADAGQMHVYLNYARENWMRADENLPVGLILCAQKNESLARYALDNLPNKVLAAEYRTVLPDEKVIAAEPEHTRLMLEGRRLSKGGGR